jgi:Flp pilus assembly protein TadD
MQQAIKDYNKAIKLNPQYATVYINRGIAYAKLGNTKQGIKDFNKTIELNPQNSLAYYNKGIAYAHLGNIKQAIENYKIAARLEHKGAQDLLKSNGIEW